MTKDDEITSTYEVTTADLADIAAAEHITVSIIQRCFTLCK